MKTKCCEIVFSILLNFQEKQEQQRQAQQQAMMHRREGSMEGMMGTGPQQITIPPGMAPYRPRMIDQNAIQRYDTIKYSRKFYLRSIIHNFKFR